MLNVKSDYKYMDNIDAHVEEVRNDTGGKKNEDAGRTADAGGHVHYVPS